MGQVGSPADVALPAALHVIVWPASVASAVPATARLFPHVALNDPFALVEVRSVTFHLKSVHDDGDGATLADAHAPMSALTPAEDGPVIELVCSNPKQPAATDAIAMTKGTAEQTFLHETNRGSQGAQGCGDVQYSKPGRRGYLASYGFRIVCRGTCRTPSR